MRRIFLAVAVTTSLLTSGASPGTFERLWILLSGLWGASAGIDAGCIWDPDGGCQPAPAPRTDAGCIWDPDGSCRPAPEPQTDAGCIWDPYGCPGS